MIRLNKIRIAGFGRFANTEFSLAPGLNVIYGGNEAGKSTLHKFIEVMLFGFWSSSGGREKEAGWQRYRPWQGKEFGGELVYTWNDRQLKVVRDFAADRVEIFDCRTSRVLEDLPVNPWGEPDIARQHLGCSKLVFRNTISISQLGLVTESDAVAEIRQMLDNLAQSGGSGISVAKALAVLQQAVVETEGQLSEAKKNCGVLGQRLADMAKLQAEANQLEQQRFQLNKDIDLCARQVQALEKKVEQWRGYEAAEKLARLQNLRRQQKQVQEELEQLGQQPDISAEAHAQYFQAKERLDKARETVAIQSRDLAEAKARCRQVENELKALESYQKFDKDTLIEMGSAYQMLKKGQQVLAEQEQQLAALAQEIRNVTASLAELPYFRPDTLELVDSLERQAEGSLLQGSKVELEQDLSGCERGMRWRKIIRGLMLLTFPVILGAAWQFAPLLGLVGFLPLAVVIAINAELGKLNLRARTLRREIYALEMEFQNSQRQREQAQREIKALYAKVGASSRQELAAKFRQFLDLSERNRELLREQKYIAGKLEEYRLDVEAREKDLREILTQVGLESLALEEALRVFRINLDKVLENKTIYAQCHRNVSECEGKLATAENHLNDAEKELEKLWAAWGVGNDAQWQQARSASLRRKELGDFLAQLEEKCRDLLQGTSQKQLEELAAAGQERPESGQGAVEELKEWQQKLLTRQGTRSEIVGRLEGIYSALEPVAELQEALWQQQAMVEALEKRKQAMEAARSIIAHISAELSSQLAPELNQQVGEIVTQITGGRYSDLEIAADMSVRVVSPEREQPVQLEELSGGTIDQFYFACRIAIADLVTGKAGLPLILDDSFVQYDDRRLTNMLSLLVAMADNRQIILLTCQRRELEQLARAEAGRYRLIALDN